MGGIHLFGRRFNFSSDDLTIPSLIDIFVRFPLIIIYIIFRVKTESSNSICLSLFYIVYFHPLLILYFIIIIVDLLICLISFQGTPVNNISPRRHIPLFIYIRLFLVLIDIVINIIGLIIILRIFQTCEFLFRVIILISIVISSSAVICLFIILIFLIDLTDFINAEKKWEMRIKFLFCCGRDYGGQLSDRKNIVKILEYLFDDERYDLVGSDVAAGLILLQEEDLLEERSIDIIESVPLDILKEGFYYNSYAQSAFGWFSLAYQYRMTFIPRILFAMRFRTIGFCCCCCGIRCCENPDSLYDPCGSQYSTLTYLLRKQNPIILYANFLGAFGRAPFYIAADDIKKTIIISIRGTLRATDILTDINLVEDVLQTELFGNGHCHSGMHSAANYIVDDISTRLNDIFIKYFDYSLVICGYSLGAGIAAILSILLKVKYPNLKCYGIAMPGSVLSENLSLATRDFIYSYVVDVDMISRASIHSLEHLRDRIIDALNKSNRNKLSILTTTFVQTLTKRRQVFHSINSTSSPQTTTTTTTTISNMDSIVSQLVLTNRSIQREPLVLPGTIIHLYSTDRVGLFTRKGAYRACISTYNQFTQFIVHPRMWFDHFPSSYSTALTEVIENYDQTSQNIV